MSKALDIAIRTAAVLVGAAAGALALLEWRVPSHDVGTGAHLTFRVRPTNAVSASETVLAKGNVRPSPRDEGLAASVELTNRLRRPVVVRVRAVPDAPDLDGILHLDAVAARTTLTGGELRNGRVWSARVTLPARATRELALLAWIPAAVTEGYQGKRTVITFELSSQPAERTP